MSRNYFEKKKKQIDSVMVGLAKTSLANWCGANEWLWNKQTQTNIYVSLYSVWDYVYNAYLIISVTIIQGIQRIKTYFT